MTVLAIWLNSLDCGVPVSLITIMFIFFLAIFLTSKLAMAEEEAKLEQQQQRESFIGCSN